MMKESLFMGKVTASMTHEIKNVLAIIRESAGLAQDLLTAAKESDFPHKEKLFGIMGKIDKQIERGADIVSRLNAFAHAPDRETSHEDLNTVLDQMVHLSHKLGRSNGVSFIGERSADAIMLDGNPMKTRTIIYQVLEFLAPLIGKGAEIRLRPLKNSKGSPGIEISIKAAGSVDYSAEKILGSPGWDSLCNEFKSENVSIGLSEGKNSLLIRFG
jgi:hypothetical protein